MSTTRTQLETSRAQMERGCALTFARVCLVLALAVIVITLFLYGLQAGYAAGPQIDPTHWASLTPIWCGPGTGQTCPPTATGTWGKWVATATPTATGTPGELVYPPVPSATATPTGVIGIPVTAVAPVITVVVTGAVPITPPGPMPTSAPDCGRPPAGVTRWTCDRGNLIPLRWELHLPLVRVGR